MLKFVQKLTKNFGKLIAPWRKPMYIYRLEHPDTGMGPYSQQDGTPDMRALGSLLIQAHSRSGLHPSPWDDGLEDFFYKNQKSKSNAYFGCSSVSDLYKWFEEFWPWLMELGYQVEIYRAKDFQVSDSKKQIAFNITTAKKI